jgi:hypothetical protein
VRHPHRVRACTCMYVIFFRSTLKYSIVDTKISFLTAVEILPWDCVRVCDTLPTYQCSSDLDQQTLALPIIQTLEAM